MSNLILDRNEKAVVKEIHTLVGINKDKNLFSDNHHEEYQTHLMHIEQAINEIRKLDPTIGY